ncbi:MAG: hypothetical protein JNK78_09085 [Planctomycetes bacterium]|nr:hypothetical protein [Planctomycetota bacterium]
MRPSYLASAFLLLCGVFAGWRTASLLPKSPLPDEPAIWTDDYRLIRKPENAFELGDGRWFVVPRLFRDFDLQMDLELGENVDVDLLVRQVEPRLVQKEIRAFPGRFVSLRLTTGKEGQAWRTRDEALFGPRGEGASLAPGLVATVWLEARGRTLRANVAGKTLPPFEADDDYGALTLIARGGKVALQRFVVTNRGGAEPWSAQPGFWVAIGVVGAALVLAVASMRAAGAVVTALLGVLLVCSGEWIARCVAVAPLAVPASGPLLALLGGAALFASAIVVVRAIGAPIARWIAVAAVFGGFVATAHLARAALRPRPSTRLDAVFGPDSGSTPSEAMAQLMRGPRGLLGPPEENAKDARVVLLGGQLLYGALRPPEEHLQGLLQAELRGATKKAAEVVTLPTMDGHTAQQWELFSRFFTGHRPRVLVFGVPADEAAEDPSTGKPRSFASTLAETIRAARAWTRENGAALVLFASAAVPGDLRDVLREAERDGVPLVFANDGDAPAAVAKKLAAAAGPLL